LNLHSLINEVETDSSLGPTCIYATDQTPPLDSVVVENIEGDFLNFLSKCKVLVLSDNVFNETKTDHKTFPLGNLNTDVKLIDLPFDFIYMEFLNHDWMWLTIEEEKKPSLGVFLLKDKSYDCYWSVHVVADGPQNSFRCYVDRGVSFGELSVIKSINNKNNGFSFCDNSKERKRRNGGRVNHIVYCDRKTVLQKNNLNIDKKPLVYYHEFDVRGHWRKIKYLGKYPTGNYGIKGATWVSPFRKGSGEYFKKDRMFI